MTEHEELEMYRGLFIRILKPEHFPFICGQSAERVPKTILVCPVEGVDFTYTYDLRVEQ